MTSPRPRPGRDDGARQDRDVPHPGTEIGIHAHENLSLSVANCPIEPFVAVAEIMDFRHGCDLFKLQDAADDIALTLTAGRQATV
ncbi:MAG: hypothetical protein Q7J48_07670 [Nocardioides sp.]|nr:hypothetical protein [Nocardioides sp.]